MNASWYVKQSRVQCPAEFHRLQVRRWGTWRFVRSWPYVQPYIESVILCTVCSYQLVEPADVTIAARGIRAWYGWRRGVAR